MNPAKYMLLALMVCTISACKSTQVIPNQAMTCPEQRPEMCTMNYLPACGYVSATVFKTYSNTCAACADPEVVAVVDGECKTGK
ncbi:MAG: hypothetical protein JXR18_02275 [Neptuniibacter sp.]